MIICSHPDSSKAANYNVMAHRIWPNMARDGSFLESLHKSFLCKTPQIVIKRTSNMNKVFCRGCWLMEANNTSVILTDRMTAMNLQVCWEDGCCHHDNQHLSRYKGSEMAEVFKLHNQWVSSSELRQSRNVCKVPPRFSLKKKYINTQTHARSNTCTTHIIWM